MGVTAISRFAVCRGHGCQEDANWLGVSRSDRLYCSSACRQRAYRHRKAADLGDADVGCVERAGEDCRWASSCSRDGCWRRECEGTGRPLFGTGPRVKELEP
jgi:hypothetical protein